MGYYNAALNYYNQVINHHNNLNAIKDALGLYLVTLIIGHTFCSMLSILNELTMQKDCKNS